MDITWNLTALQTRKCFQEKKEGKIIQACARFSVGENVSWCARSDTWPCTLPLSFKGTVSPTGGKHRLSPLVVTEQAVQVVAVRVSWLSSVCPSGGRKRQLIVTEQAVQVVAVRVS